jgi:enoyl-CoA hydratase/carnithine racemase
MKHYISLKFEDDDFKSYLENEILVVYIKNNAFEIATDLSESAYLFEILDLAEKSTEVKAVFIYNSPGCFGDEEYEVFLKKIFRVNGDSPAKNFGEIEDQSRRIRQINILNHFIYQSVNFKKLLIMGLQGCVVTPFIGACLAADLRFATNDMQFSFAHLKYGLHPTGALPFLLPKYIGLSKSKYCLYHGGTINAREALDLNLVNKVFTPETFLESSIAEISDIIKYDSEILSITKKLFHINPEELQKYFEYETQKTVLK